MEPTSMDFAGRRGGTPDCNRPDLSARLCGGEELGGAFGKEIELHSRNCATCGLRLSLVRQAEGWLADQGSSNRSPVRSSSPCPSAEELFDFGHGPGAVELPAAQTRRIEAHLVECADCRGLVATLATRPPAPLLDGAKLRPLDARPSPAATAPPPLRALHDAPRRTPARRQPWLAYAAAAAIMAGAFYVWKSRGAPQGAERSEVALLANDAASVFPNLPVLRGDTSLALRFPSGRVLAAAPNSIQEAGEGTWHGLHFEITPQAEAQSYRIELSRAAESAFGKPQLIAEHGSPQPSFELPAGLVQPLAPGEYAWEAWALVNGLEQPLGTRSFEVVDDAAARDQLRICNALAEPARSKTALGWLVAHEFFSDARAWARALPQSPERDAFLAGFPGR